MRHPVVMGNWKLNGSKEMVVELLNGLNAELEGVTGVDVAVAPPALFIDLAERTLTDAGSAIILGAQNSDVHNSGAFTGDMSPAMLKEFGATHIIIGHSERREYHNESDEFVAQKFAFLKENGLTPVLCIGESEAQNEAGETVAVCARQLDAVINTQGVEALEGAIIAYEPIWAIGTGKAATADDAQRIHAAIRAHIAAKSEAVAKNVVIQYGGSVKPENAAAYFAQPDIDGALVGGAALDAKSFAAIAKAAAEAKKA
ncbi:triose-phosphate isomerase [Vibrio anguillarum]|uniref:Triosephosphate isomerase n=3 Tax=Vibrio TaxID=662 RepID=A0A1Q1LNH0_VIBAN|nr:MULTISPECIES: triose-phosphate isomerase [Vibrio]OXX72215.1 triose-phosphate isomerase [Vibrio sp. V03_P4A6T147]AQM18612.1 triose-phosphate isomerase [Vibrio anguillarum]AQP35161.1 triose-phosphate isomerase [Vibrio anguillarum]ARV26613.1 triose-phosphate isomerase [Vibrio anguillarum]ASF92938.1 triose-phosphate isomerase [Vibrio anguillarum]